jgi:general secretion pathway protein D
VLSAPTLLTTDNEEAQIVVGQNVPFLASAASSSAAQNTIFNSVNRQNVGITLDIVPQISDGDYVKLDVYEEVSAVVPSSSASPLGPTTTIRSASTTVLVQNHRTTVIGGLMSDETSRNHNGVPFISNLPVVGNLFSNDSHNGDKTNLLVFLTPHVIRDREDLRELSLEEREKFIGNLNKKDAHDMPMPQVRELYKPSFSIAVPPAAELGTMPKNLTPARATYTEPESRSNPYVPTPPNTEEVGAKMSRASTPAVLAPIAPAAPATASSSRRPLSRVADTTPTMAAPVGASDSVAVGTPINDTPSIGSEPAAENTTPTDSETPHRRFGIIRHALGNLFGTGN